MKKNMRKALSWIMILCMVLSMVPAAAVPGHAVEDDRTVNGYYENGQWVQGGSGTVSHDVDGTEVTLSKTAQAVEGKENTYDITLTVKTSTSSSVHTDAGAVVLVIDTSSSMQSCANCGQRTGHTNGCTDRSQNRLQAAKAAANEFLASYAGSDANATRMLAIVTFDGGYRTNMSWANVAGGSGSNSYNSARDIIDGLGYDQGTNMEGGLKLALDLLGSDAVSGFGSMNVVLLSDGAPSQRIGNSDLYGSNKADCDAAANQAAAIRATGSKLYTVCFGAARDNAYDNVTVSSFLSSRIASSGCAYDADNASQLNAAFKAITESITSGLSGKGWTVTDPMAPHVSVSGGIGENFFKDGSAYTWRLNNVKTETVGNTTYYIYTYTYRITIDPQFEGFEEGAYYPANDRTFLNIEGKQYEFPVPGVQATLPRKDVTVTKVWNDENNQDGIRPTEITVQLMEGERTIGESVVLNASNNWSYTWDGETYDLIVKSEGKVHVYTVKEIGTPKDYTYTTSFEDSRITLTNSHEVYKTAVEVTKVWNDADNQDGKRPDAITVRLWADGVEIASAQLTANGGWKHVFDGLDLNSANGKAVVYTVTEDAVPGYTTAVSGHVITNTHEVEKTSVPVTKVWNDADNQDGIRPTAVTVKLLANGVDTGKTLTLTAATGWTGAFTGLDKYSKAKVIDYTLAEVPVEGYTTTVSGNTITNTHTPAVTEVSGVKTWVDNDNQDGVRPGSITVNLVKNGQIIATKTVTEADGWAWSFTDLPKFENGELTKYAVTENEVEGYSASYNGYNITNTHTPDQTSVTVVKAWEDANNQDGMRPNSITVKLLANGQDTGKTLVLSDANAWTGSFSSLDVNKAGQKITYTIEEISVEGYTTAITGDQAQGFTVTNTHETETVDIAGAKTWIDNNNQDGFRPASITIHLTANGKTVATKTVTGPEWSWSFNGQPKYENGRMIEYAVIEEAVEDYSTSYNGYNVTNTHTPEQTSVTVTKSWQDKDDQDGLRTNTITVKLLANGQDTGKTLVLTEGNSWTGSFTELDKYEGGEVITYTVQELNVPGYQTVVEGSQAEGFTLVNIHIPETVKVQGTKTWNDNNDQDGARPASITVYLLKNGEAVDSKTVSGESWSWSFENLPKYENHGTLINYSVKEEAVEGYTTVINGYNITNTHAPEQTSVTVTKSWKDSDDQDGIRPNSITVELVANGTATGETLVLTDNNNWNGTFTELDKYAEGVEIVYTVRELTVAGYDTVITGTQTEGYVITNSHTPETVAVSGTKTWNDNNNQDGVRPESITVELLKNGKVHDTATVTAEDGWSWSFTGLARYENHGTPISYSVRELAVEGYVTEINGYNITNTHAPEQTSVTVTKAWADSDDQDGIRPNSVTVELVANGEATGKTLVLSQGNNWTGSFTGLDKFSAGVEIVYTVTEAAVAEYTSVITGNQTTGYTITNSHNPATTEISGSKTWNDNDNQDGFRPASITVNLLADGVVIQNVTVTEADNWSWSFENLPKYKNHGTEIVYTVTEDAVEGYTTEINGFNVTNTHAPEKTSVNVVKAWADSDNQDGIRPNSVTVELVANGKNTGVQLVLNQGNGWSGIFPDLDKYEAGTEIVYTVQELTVAGYESVVAGDQKVGYTVTNTHNPETMAVSGSKTWKDNDNQDGFRPASITIRLLADGVEIRNVTVTEADNWSWNFENLPKYRDQGTLIEYAVTEDAVADYSTTYQGTNVTNEHTPEQTSVTVTKAWADSNDQDGIRPNSITVELVANGEATGVTLVLSEGNNWVGTFSGLDKYQAGTEIVYSVRELTVAGYETVITGDQYSGYHITNSHNPETVAVSGAKTWNDNDNQDGFRPASITVNLLADGVVTETVTVTEADGWAWHFENLAKYKDHGTEIVYTVTENQVDAYITEVNGYNITNTHAPEKTSVNVVKAWADSDNQDGIRPADITVELIANGEPTGKTLVLSSGNNWNGTFTDLDKYEKGEVIAYTVEEIAIEGYETVITGDQKDGYTVTNSHNPETVAVSGSKTWKDHNNQDGFRPESITINLLADGEIIYTKVVTEADGWAWSFENLPKFKNQGVEIVYSIVEEAVENYSASYDGFNVTNEHTPEQTSVTVTKAWADNDDQDGIRPETVEVILLANGEATGEKLKLNAENNWTGSFTELDRYAEGMEIVYTVEELAVAGYETVITGTQTEGYVITNSHNPETVEVAGTKTWNDNNNQDGVRPASITINLMKNGAVLQTITVTEAEGWAWSFTDLPKYENQGAEIVYSITEAAVEGYTTVYDGYNVINERTPDETSVTVTKSWVDGNDGDGIRPGKITIRLLADGKDTGKTLVLNAKNNWTGSFTGLAKNAEGKAIVYTVTEDAVKGYNAVIKGDMASGFVVTNTHTYIPKTGDERSPMLWMLLMLFSGGVIAATVVDQRKRYAK